MSMGMVAHVRDFSKSKRDTKFLLLMLASYINPATGWAWPSLDTLAHVTGFGKPYLLKMIRGLEALGELEVRRGRGHSNHYGVTRGKVR
jgi:Helix-turn-helix domain